MRTRLTPRKEPDYQVQRSNFRWDTHIERLLVTGSMIAWLKPETICDPACGDGSVLEAAYRQRPFVEAYLGDISAPNIERLDVTFPVIRARATAIGDTFLLAPHVDVVVLTEILEHLEDPDAILRLARSKGTTLVASSPLDPYPDPTNDEHLWDFDEAGYEEMIKDAGWTPTSHIVLTWPRLPYGFQIWTAS